jgi:hypothetical protein
MIVFNIIFSGVKLSKLSLERIDLTIAGENPDTKATPVSLNLTGTLS